jgi:beta-lactamase class A
VCLSIGCARDAKPASTAAPIDWTALRARLEARIARSEGEVELMLIDLAGGDRIAIHADVPMHAASTMKVPVLYELFRRSDAGAISIDDSIDVTDEFRSLAGDTIYRLLPADDSDSTLYARVGGRETWRNLATLMITRSSNLATNNLIDRLGAASIRSTLDSLGASGMHVLRGVEDGPAFRKGLNNETTAAGLAAVFEAIARCTGLSAASCDAMKVILAAQEFNDMIPADLPPGVRIAHKTGWITGIRHDGGIVYPEGRAPWVLVILTRGFEDPATADTLGAGLSREVWDALIGAGDGH